MFKLKIIAVLLLGFQCLFAQDTNGYWDNVRITSETITLKAGEKKILKTADFPQGTTEIVIRITVLDDNQQMTSSLVSLLKAIPDPTGISQGSAGAIFLLSKVSGVDKCKYAVFNSNDMAKRYFNDDKNTVACWKQDTPINKEAKVISITNSKCLPINGSNLWFGFESDNWVMNQKILLEVVPWVDAKLSRGWNTATKKQLLEDCKQLKIFETITKKDPFCNCYIETITKKFTYKEYLQLLPSETSNEATIASEFCIEKTGEKEVILNNIRMVAYQYYEKGDYEKAIQLLQESLVDKGLAKAKDYDTLSQFYLLSKQYLKAENAIKEGLKLDSSVLNFQHNLAHVYLFTDEFSKAKAIHEKYKSQNITATKSWKQQTIDDFALFEANGFPTKNFKRILKIIK